MGIMQHPETPIGPIQESQQQKSHRYLYLKLKKEKRSVKVNRRIILGGSS
jgi:hypothetical protein